ncbi:GntR family transcriptional regulator [Tsukamurella soli]|uniref:GntR family transcriptional regulator n=1 Tax=Tsukamurella soli TaxID=644556 RepID=UPI0031F0879E
MRTPSTGPGAANESGRPERLRSERARRLADRIRQDVLGGRFAAGALPDEHHLVTEYGASRNAVREALRLLAAEGLLVRRPGFGTRVAAQKFAHSLDRLAGLAETLNHRGGITNEVRSLTWQAAAPDVARRLDVDPGTTVLYLERLRTLDGEPLSVDCSHLTADIGAELVTMDLGSRDVFELIELIVGMPLGVSEVAVHAVNAESDVADVLGLAARDAVFTVDRLTRLADGRPVDLETLHIRGDRMSFTSVLHRSPGPGAPPSHSVG